MTDLSTGRRVDTSLRYLLAQWGRVPEFVKEWHESWDEGERLSFAMEWNHTEATLADLRERASAESLTAKQSNRYAELESLVRKYKAGIRALVYEDMPEMIERLESQPDGSGDRRRASA